MIGIERLIVYLQMELLEITFKDLLNPEFYIVNGGLWLFLFIVFAETGLFAGFFLPAIPFYLLRVFIATN